MAAFFSFAQNCESFLPMSEGYRWEVTNFNKKGKEESKVINEITSVKIDGQKQVATVQMTVNSGKDTYESEYEYTCSADKVTIGMSLFMPSEQLEQIQNMESMEMELQMEDMEFPSHLKVGNDLKEAKMTMVAKANGIKVMSSETTIKDRKIVDRVKVTTAAGTFDCYQLRQTTVVKMGFANREYQSVSYISEGVGVVRTENLDKKGEVESYSEITALK